MDGLTGASANQGAGEGLQDGFEGLDGAGELDLFGGGDEMNWPEGPSEDTLGYGARDGQGADRQPNGEGGPDGERGEAAGDKVNWPEGARENALGQDAAAGKAGETDAEGVPKDGEAAGGQQKPDGEDAAGGEDKDGSVTLGHDGRQVRVGREELIELAQKGLDYDQMRERAENNPAVKVLERYAQASGMSLEGYLGFLEKSYQDNQVAQLVEGGMSEPVARQQVALQQQLAAQRRAEEDRRADDAARQAQQARVDAFLPLIRKYPEAGRALPAPVLEMIQGGAPPLLAYEHWQLGQEMARMKAGFAAGKAAEKNRQTAPGSAKGAGGAPPDGFLAALMGD